jgi:hypothetical protein
MHMTNSTGPANTKPISTAYKVGPAKRATFHKRDAPVETAPIKINIEEHKLLDVEAAPVSKTAVFVAHGMGQQITFQTLDQIAEGLRQKDPRWNTPALPDPFVRVVKSGEETLTRIELKLCEQSGIREHEVHIYEGYWAPLTEGQITLRDVIGFLFTAGTNGVRKGIEPFQRWSFRKYHDFGVQIHTAMILLIALTTVAALVAINSTIVLVSAARSPLQTPPAWLSNSLFADLTTTFNMLLAVMIVFALSLLICKRAKNLAWSKQVRLKLANLTFGLLLATLAATTLAGISLPALFYWHVMSPSLSEQLWPHILGEACVEKFNRYFTCIVVSVLVLLALFFLAKWLYKHIDGVWRSLRERKDALTWSVAGCLVGILVLAVAGLIRFWLAMPKSSTVGTLGILKSGVSWPLLVVVSAIVRRLLIQYLGDVAAYVTPHKLDRFNELRNKIKACVARSARAVYSLRQADGVRYEYERVVIVGHSLGSVIVYDVLNGLINEDELADGNAGRNVVGRTPLLLTFGSPLDKTAYLFAMQARETSEAREALAAAVQPLILDYKFRPPTWINIWSPNDIISGNLDFYDPPQNGQPHVSMDSKLVQNIPDEEATTPLIAHLEYWNNPLLFRTLYDELTSPIPSNGVR